MKETFNRIRISMLGCCLVDRLYTDISFSSHLFKNYLSHKRADGGLMPGKLVFREEFEKFCEARGMEEIIYEITNGRAPKKNIGGPGIVPIIHAKQIINQTGIECCFYGGIGNDVDGEFILSVLKKTGISPKKYIPF